MTCKMAMATRMVFVGADRNPCLIVEERSVPSIQEGEILAKVRLATICGSDQHTIIGRRQEAIPSVLGHEGIAEILDIKRSESDLKVGDRITFSIADSCGRCNICMSNIPQKCERLFKYGHTSIGVGTGFSGTYASHIVLKSGTAVFKVPDHVTDKMAAPINCALATMIHALESVKKHNNSNGIAVIQGAGLLGMYGCALLHERGFKHVFCTDVNKTRLQLVQLFGGIPVNIGVNQSSSVLLEKYGNKVDVVVEVCGSPSVVPEGVALLRPGGRYIFVGMVHPDSHLDITAEQLIRKCLTIKGIHNYAPEHLKLAVEFISQTAGRYPYDRLVGQEYSLREIQGAVQLALKQVYFRVGLRPS